MLWVELAEHGGDAAAGDGLVAAGAERAAHRVVVRLAVRQPVVLEEVAAHKGLLKSSSEIFWWEKWSERKQIWLGKEMLTSIF